MFLYRLEASGSGFPPVAVIVLADSDEKAFTYARRQIERDFLGSVEIRDFAIVQKKTVSPGTAYTVEKNLSTEA